MLIIALVLKGSASQKVPVFKCFAGNTEGAIPTLPPRNREALDSSQCPLDFRRDR